MAWYKDKIFWCIVGTLAVLKLAAFCGLYFLYPSGESTLIFPDSLGYVYPAQTFLTYGSMWEAVSASPMLLRTPGYPFFLAAVGLLTGNLTWTVVLAQNVLSVLLLLPVYLTTNRLNGQTAARWAAGFCAASVLYFSLSFAVLTETVCVFLLAWFVFFIIRYLSHPRAADLLYAALWLAAAVCVRPAAYYFMPVAVLLLAGFRFFKTANVSLKHLVFLFILPLVLVIGMWHLRNFRVSGFGGFTTVGAYNLYIWNEDYTARKYGISIGQAHERLLGALPENFSSLPAGRQARVYKQMARPLLRESFLYKLTHAPLWAGKTLFGANFAQISQLLNQTDNRDSPQTALNHTKALPTPWMKTLRMKILFLLCSAQVFITVLAGLAGLVLLGRQNKNAVLFLSVYCLYFWGIGSVFFGAYARFRAPFEFVLCIAAGTAATWLFNRKQNAKTKGKSGS